MDYSSLAQWLHDANESIHINLTRPSRPPAPAPRILAAPFHPNGFTSELFEDCVVADQEVILGYREPRIELDFRANDLRPRVTVSYKAKWDAAQAALLETEDSQVRQVDIDTVFAAFVPQRTSTAGPDAASSDWTPPGQRTHAFALHEKQYEVWSTSLADAYGLELWENMQLLVLLLIDGASPIELGEDWTYERWTLHLLYEVTPLEDASVSPYTLAGCCTSYRYWIFPTSEILRATKSLPSPPPEANGNGSTSPAPRRHELAELGQEPHQIFKERLDPLSTPSRERISQFLILPPYQNQSLGARLYSALFAHYVSQPNIYEIPVEDPNVEFDAMRDYADIAYLRSLPEFASLELPSSVPAEMLRKDVPVPREYILGEHNGTDLLALRHKSKIVPRQFARLLELHLLSKLPPMNRNRSRITRKEKSSNENDRRYYFWRLAVKARIYSQNADSLDQMKDDPEQRNNAIEGAVDNQQEEYEERFVGIDRRERRSRGESVSDDDEEEETGGDPTPVSTRGLKRNRAVVVEDEEDEEWEDEESVSSKKPKA